MLKINDLSFSYNGKSCKVFSEFSLNFWWILRVDSDFRASARPSVSELNSHFAPKICIDNTR